MADLLSPEDTAEAKRLGWKVIEVYDLKTKRMVVDVIAHGHESWSRDKLMSVILTHARGNVSCACATLRAIVTKGKK